MYVVIKAAGLDEIENTEYMSHAIDTINPNLTVHCILALKCYIVLHKCVHLLCNAPKNMYINKNIFKKYLGLGLEKQYVVKQNKPSKEAEKE